jgi:hypothetical protein
MSCASTPDSSVHHITTLAHGAAAGSCDKVGHEKEFDMMKFASFLAAIGVAVTFAAPSASFAQTRPADTTPVTGMKPDRVTAPRYFREAMQKREAVKRQKRADCRAKAKAEKVSLWKRPAYVKRCVTQPS